MSRYIKQMQSLKQLALLLIGLYSTNLMAAEDGQRLSQILRQKQQAQITATQINSVEPIFLPGIMWLVPEEKLAQEQLKNELLTELSALHKKWWWGQAVQANRASFKKYLEKLPVTNRALIYKGEVDWLEANPKYDPIILSHHRLEFRKNPEKVTVLFSDGKQCSVPHRSGVYARHYVDVCQPKKLADWAWLIQADGAINKIALRTWNESHQIEAAPGAWIWAPNRMEGWSDVFSNKLAAFLATQGPSGDALKDYLPNMGHIIDTPAMLLESQSLTQRDLPISQNDFGVVGVLQTPTARFAEAGTMAFSVSHANPYTRMSMFFTPFQWLEAGIRYTDISNRLYGPSSFSGSQTYKDKSADIKVRLWEEGAYWPQVAVGIKDIGGTGLFSTEYMVASKRWGNFDFSAGLATGYLGHRGDISNPIGSFMTSYKERKVTAVGQGGTFSPGTFFSGPVGMFGGVQYHTPWNNWVVKAELDGNDYKTEPLGNSLKQRVPINFGVSRLDKNFDVTVGFERGNTAMVTFVLHGNMSQVSMPKVSMPPIVPLSQKVPPDSAVVTQTEGLKIIEDIHQQTDWDVRKIEQLGQTWVVEVTATKGLYIKDLIPRVIRVLHNKAPAKVKTFRLAFYVTGIYSTEYKIDRYQYIKNQTQWLAPSQDKPVVEIDPVGHPWKDDYLKAYQEQKAQRVQGIQEVPAPLEIAMKPEKRYDYGIGTFYKQVLGGPDGFWFYTLGARAGAYANLWEGAWVGGAVDYQVLSNMGSYKHTGSSSLPRVRTYLQQYSTTTDVTIPQLRFVQAQKIADNQYVAVYGGLLENYFGGVGAEWLYRRSGSPWAVGVDVNRVRQRDFEQKFGFMDYRVTTGHLSLYWDTGWQGLNVKTSMGQYLAGDRGVTLDLGKIFDNGARVGAFATKTNVSAAQFGEGSFDKGIYFSIPFDSFLTKYSNSSANFVWRPTVRDGGAMLDRGFSLLEVANMRDPRMLSFGPPTSPNQKDK